MTTEKRIIEHASGDFALIDLSEIQHHAERLAAMMTTVDSGSGVSASRALLDFHVEVKSAAYVQAVAQVTVSIIGRYLLEAADTWQIPIVLKNLSGFMFAYRIVRPGAVAKDGASDV